MGKRCIYCNRIVALRRNLSGTRVLELDVAPAPDGTVLLILARLDPELAGRAVELGGRYLEDVRADGTPLYRYHSCENGSRPPSGASPALRAVGP